MDPAVGSRLNVGKHGATIRYVGPVEGQGGVWVGVEWDDPTRGKHDGRHNGKRYFSCLRHTHSATTAGSFVRLPKLIATADLGQSLETAIQSRYKTNTDEDENIIDDPEVDSEAYVPTASNRKVQIRIVGAAAMAALVSQDGALEHASFINQRISNITITPQMGIPFLRNVATLDLSNNLIGSWAAVAELLNLLPKLHTLNLSGNSLEIHTPDRIETSGGSKDSDNSIVVPTLKTLVLNNCGIKWPEVVFSLAQCLPNLTALHLCRNNITNLELPLEVIDGNDTTSAEKVHEFLASKFTRLETLDLEENNLSEWNEIAAQLHALPRLKTLLLSGNSLEGITYPSTSNTRRISKYDIDSKFNSALLVEENNNINGSGEKGKNEIDEEEACGGGFRCLEHLMVGSNRLHEWHVADELDKFPSLIDLRISKNPLTNAAVTGGAGAITDAAPTMGAIAVRYELIARASKLQMLNGSDIRAGERQDAELAYLRLITDQLAEAKAIQTMKEGTKEEHQTAAAVMERHPKFSFLVAKYGELAASGPSSSQGTTLSSFMVELIFISGAKKVKKKVPATLTIGRLKPLLERVLRIKLGHQCISLVDPSNGNNREDVTSQDGKELGFYGVANGWRVEVGERDVAAAAAAKGAMVAEQERRMEEHERGLQRLRAEEERLMVG